MAAENGSRALTSNERRVMQRRSYWRSHYDLYIMLIPALIYYFLFRYVPIGGLQLAFKEYNFSLGIMRSPWIGFQVFGRLFSENMFWRAVRNTLLLNMGSIIIVFPMPIVFALMINELKSERYKRLVQSVSYLPHFISWVILYGIILQFVQIDTGLFNIINKALGRPQSTYLTETRTWLFFWFAVDIWKESGWQSILYLSALSAIDPGLYEAAAIDGAGRLRSTWHITLPGIRGTIVIILILQVGRMMSMGFDKPYNFSNSRVRDVSDVLSTYIYQQGVVNAKYNLTTAADMFQGVINFIMLLLADRIAKLFGQEGLF
ncbi:MAG: ABC transporter permease [Christensenellales bacterium]